MQCDNELYFLVGERKFVDSFVMSEDKNEVVVINSATYELKDGSKVIEQGKCEIKENKMTCLLEIDKTGVYELMVTATVGAEIIKQKARVYVN